MPYICYLTDPDFHSNAADTYPGHGRTKREAAENACYYANQWPWTRIVAASRAPRWAQRQARDARWLELEAAAGVRQLTRDEALELECYQCRAFLSRHPPRATLRR